MKRNFTLLLLALLLTTIGGVKAQTLRKTWDFRDGFSTKTINALQADMEEFGPTGYWRNYESDATKADQQHFWSASSGFINSDGYACTHSGDRATVIPETEGLQLGAMSDKHFVITYNGSRAANEGSPNGYFPYGTSYLWINGSSKTIKFTASLGQKIRVGVESHSNSAKRGVKIAASNGTLTLEEGEPEPIFFNECVWSLAGNENETATITLTTTSGCHIYYIIVGDGDDPNANKTQVAYVTAGDATDETVYQTLAANEDYIVTALDASTLTADQLSAYAATVVSPALPADNAAVAVLKEALPFNPILNLNADLYAAWGYGEKATGEPLAILKNLKNDLFDGFKVEEDYFSEDGMDFISFDVYGAEQLTGVQLTGDYFAADDTLATNFDETMTFMHVHNIYHNAYVYLPQEAVNAATPHAKLLENAIALLKSSKSDVEKTSAPKIALEYKDQKTNITLAMASSNLPKPHIYYTLDGQEPTEASAEYTEMLTVAAPCTVKAVAIAEGYLLSDVATAEVEIFSQPASPVITRQYNDGATEVTLTCATEGAELWYNYTASNDTTQSMKYTEPITIKLPTDFTAFAVTGGQVFSELTTERVVVKDVVVRIDPLGVQFDANTDDWRTDPGSSTIYYFSWGKTAKSIYDETQDPIGFDENNEPIFPEREYEYVNPGNGWEVKSKGQVMIYQVLSIGKDPGNAGGYNPETAGDILSYANATSNDIQFGGKVSGQECTGLIQSTNKYQAPFDVVTILGTAGDNPARMQVEISTDSINWTALGDEMTTSSVKRLWKTYTRSYEGTDEVYVRVAQAGGGASAQIYNIYILNTGEQSAELKAQYDEEYRNATSGIEDVQMNKAKVAAGIYNLNGVRQNGLQRGLNIVVLGDGTVKKVVVK